MTKLYIESTGGLEFPGGLMVKGLALPLLWPRFDPWPRNFHMPQAQTKRKRKKKREKNPYCY